jgi:hypothetical protein
VDPAAGRSVTRYVYAISTRGRIIFEDYRQDFHRPQQASLNFLSGHVSHTRLNVMEVAGFGVGYQPYSMVSVDLGLWTGYRSVALPHWAVAALTAASALLFRARRRHLGRCSGLCPTCGYDLRASPERCPECGATPQGAI